MVPVRYELLARDPASHARLGRVHTPHGVFDTPAFMPVGTQGTIKGLTPEQVRSTGAQCILANTYHLHLRPGPETVAALGGLHRFMGWSGPILTDSGGFQVFSLGHINRIDDDGVEFRSHIDGRRVRLDPESATRTQNLLGADILMAFDQCPPGDAPDDVHRVALERTLRWAERCVRAHARPHEQALFGIVQGGTDLERRAWCARRLIELDLPGYALGGLAVGEGYAAMVRVLEATTPLLPPEKPRYLMGVGFPRDIVAAVLSGVDMFDCVMPTRNGRNAYAFTAAGPLRLRNAKLAMELGPIEEGCDCYACRTFTRGAVRHFFQAGEMLGPILVSLHNIRFYQRLMADLRRAIAAGSATAFVATDPRCWVGPSEEEEPKGKDREDVPAGAVRVRENGGGDPGSGGRRAQQDDA
ncbi:MAG: tRNA guanosine(34) transglycosylase Tgt [Tepidisphaerales bacterium]